MVYYNPNLTEGERYAREQKRKKDPFERNKQIDEEIAERNRKALERLQRAEARYGSSGAAERLHGASAEELARIDKELEAVKAAELAEQQKRQEEQARQLELEREQRRREEFILRKREQGNNLTEAEGFFLRSKNVEPSITRERKLIEQKQEEGYEPVYEGRKLVGFQKEERVTDAAPLEEGEMVEPEDRDGGWIPSLLDKYERAETKVRKYTTDPLRTKLGKYGINVTSPELHQALSPSIIGIGPFGLKPSKEQNIQAIASRAITKDIFEHPLKQAALFGVGAGAGFASTGAVTGATAISSSAGAFTSGVTAGAGVGLTGYAGYNIYQQVKAKQTFAERTEVLSVAAKDVLLLGAGYKIGTKGFQKTQGFFRTLGREEVSLQKLTTPEVYYGEKAFPTASKSQHLRLFQENVAGRYIGEQAGGFHTTPYKFWKGEIVPAAGSSELQGLYVSSYVSPHFAKVGGGYSSSYKIGLFQEASVPSTAYLIPKGFRISPYSSSAGGYKFNLPAKKGFLDIPLMKTEIEAIARPEAGAYTLKSGNYYTKIQGVRVPIDVFEYGGTGSKTLASGLSSGKYSSAYPSSSITPSTFAPLGVSVKSAQPSKPLTSIKSSISKVSYPVSKVSSKTSYKSKPSSISYPSSIKKASSSISRSSYKPSYTTYKASSYYPKSSSYSSSSYSKITRTKRTPILSRYKSALKPKKAFGVQVRRFGKFRSVGRFSDIKLAFNTGKAITSKTLAASFKVTGLGNLPKLPSGFRKSTRERGVFIEKRKYRLSRKLEKQEIQEAKRKAKKKKKKR